MKNAGYTGENADTLAHGRLIAYWNFPMPSSSLVLFKLVSLWTLDVVMSFHSPRNL
jgi:hypothetical protein